MKQAILRPVESQELGHLLQLQWDPSAPGEFQWFGFRMDTVRELERIYEEVCDSGVAQESRRGEVELPAPLIESVVAK